MLVVVNETTQLIVDPSTAEDRAEMVAAAAFFGCRVYDFEKSPDGDEETRRRLLTAIPAQSTPVPLPALWLGFIPGDGLYETVYETLLTRGIRLLNTPEEHTRAMEFDRAYPLLEGITPETVVLHHPEDWRRAETQLGYPVFVRGAVRSRKSSGWRSCVAENREELLPLVHYLFASPFRSRGSVLVRRLLSLRHTRHTPQGFPKGREYRVFLYQGEVLGWGYYWDGDDPLRRLDIADQDTVISLAQEAARRISVTFLAVDIGQTTKGDWTIIEVGDAQFAGRTQTPLYPLWESLVQHCGTPVNTSQYSGDTPVRIEAR